MSQINSKTIGDRGEDLAAAKLEAEGYTILRRNFSQPFGEIDIIALKDDVTYFVEVKSREESSYNLPSASITRRKRGQIARAALAWFAQQERETMSSLLVAEVFMDSGTVVLFEDFLC